MTKVEAYAGRYKDEVAVYKNEPTTNADGQQVEAGDLFIRRRAKIVPISGDERFQAEQMRADVTHEVRMRFDRETRRITSEDWLIREDGTRLDIKGVSDVERVERKMMCNERI